MERRTYWVLSGLYAIHFGVLGIWIPYWPLYLTGVGLSITDVGVLTAMAQGIKILGPPFWGGLADRGSHKQVFILASFLTGATFCLYFAGDGFVYLLLVTMVYSLCGPLALVDTITMDTIHQQGGDYGRIRLWGSLAFILFALLLGPVTEQWGLASALVAIALLLWLGVALALLAPAREVPHPHDENGQGWFRQGTVRRFLLASFFLQFSHGGYYGFMSIHLAENGYSKTVIGLLWSLGVIAEVGVMVWSAGLLARFSLSRMLNFSIAMAALRWGLYAVTIWPPLLLLGQTLHAFTFGSYHVAAIQRVHQTAPANSRATAQAWYGAISFGLGGSLGLISSGYLYHHHGAAAMFAVMTLAATLGWLVNARGGGPR